jgi:hypothetical protein
LARVANLAIVARAASRHELAPKWTPLPPQPSWTAPSSTSQHFAAPRLAEAEMLFRRKTGVSGDDVYQTSLMTTDALRRLWWPGHARPSQWDR